MRVSSIYAEVSELIGSCSEAVIFTAITRGLELISGKDLFDPQIGYLDFSVTEGNLFALPRDVKSPIRININTNPAFSRAKLFEFAMNTDGTVEGEEVGWAWSDRGTLPINDERGLPGKLSYICNSVDDIGKSITCFGKDMDGRDTEATLFADISNATKSTQDWIEVNAVRRQATIKDCSLYCDLLPLARYYPDEELPRYRVIKLSRTNVTVRMIYRKENISVKSQDDILPINSALGLLQAVRAYRYYQLEQYELGTAAEAKAVMFVQEDQKSRNDYITVSPALEIQTAINSELRSTDGLIVADVYDEASEIWGPIGRQKLFDRITDAVEALSRKTNWDSVSGVVDIWKPVSIEKTTRGRDSGYFVLPRFVEGIQAITRCCGALRPRNSWYQFHVNGPGERNFAPCGGFEECGETVLIQRLPLGADLKPKGVKLATLPLLQEDEDTEVRVFGLERLSDGTIVPIRRLGVEGYLVKCKFSGPVVTSDAPAVVEVHRIDKKVTAGFLKLVVADEVAGSIIPADLVTESGDPLVTEAGDVLSYEAPTVTASSWAEGLLLGHYYPDELEPRYRAIQIDNALETRIRVKFRRRTTRYTSLYEPIPLRSRLAVVAMLRAVKLQATDITAAVEQQALAMQYLNDEAVSSSPTDVFDMQISGMIPTHRRNIA